MQRTSRLAAVLPGILFFARPSRRPEARGVPGHATRPKPSPNTSLRPMRGTSADVGSAGVSEFSAPPRAVVIRDDVIVKTQGPEASRRERLRTQAGHIVGEQTGLFVVPRIITFDDARGQLVFERLPVFGLQEALADRNRGLVILERVAHALAAIHRGMASGGKAAKAGVPLHGDFGLTNVLYLPASDRLAIIDWANAEWIGFDGDYGPPELDVAVFLTSMFHRRAFYPRQVASRHEVARHFLATYASVSPHGLDLTALRSIVTGITPAFIRLTRRLRGSLRALAYRHSMIDLDLFLRRAARTPTQL
jgi:tRNA A-37 threonylcarbamoyl transferase component Bud32